MLMRYCDNWTKKKLLNTPLTIILTFLNFNFNNKEKKSFKELQRSFIYPIKL